MYAADEPVIIRYSRERAFPISTLTSVFLHIGFLAAILLGFLSLFQKPQAPVVEIEPIVFAEAPGGGAGRNDTAARFGSPTATEDDSAAMERQPSRSPDLAKQPEFVARQEPPPMALLQPSETDAASRIEQRVAQMPSAPNLKPLLRGLPDGKAPKGTIGAGAGRSPGSGPGSGDGLGASGKLTQKQARQLRWTLIFSTRGSADYLDQLHRMKAIIGLQFPDQSIKLITNLKQRPVRLVTGERVPDRIFWIDDNTDAVAAMTKELGLSTAPWRVIAFFPASLEEELARKEKAHGKRFGRESEDDIAETAFRVTDNYGNIDITVERQTGKP